MSGQDLVTERTVLHAALVVLEAHGYHGLTLERLAAQTGVSRMTLHRKGVSVAAVVAGLSLQAVQELQAGLLPALTGPGSAAVRLEATLRATFVVADAHLPLLAGLYADGAGIFHAPPDTHGAVATHEVFVAPYVRLLQDGALDGSLTPVADLLEAATVLFNTAGWGYVHLREAQRWPPERAASGVLALVLHGLVPQ